MINHSYRSPASNHFNERPHTLGTERNGAGNPTYILDGTDGPNASWENGHDGNYSATTATDPDLEEQRIATGRRIKIVLVTQWVCLVFFFTLVTVIITAFPPWKLEYQNSDFLQTFWALIGSSLTLSQVIMLLIGSHLRRSGYSIPTSIFYFQRLLRSSSILWFICGIKPLFWDAPRNPTAVRLARSLWITQAVFFFIPLLIYLLICFCMPCLLIFRHRMHGPSLNATPTPDWILSKLEVRKYNDLLEYFRNELDDVEQPSTSPQHTPSRLQNTIHPGALIEALTSVTTGGIRSSTLRTHPLSDGGNNDSSNLLRPLRMSTEEATRNLKVEKCCPICITDFEGSEDVMLMPCDKRHFFHVDCVRKWLHGSQYCPICRANVVALTSREAPETAVTIAALSRDRQQTSEHHQDHRQQPFVSMA